MKVRCFFWCLLLISTAVLPGVCLAKDKNSCPDTDHVHEVDVEPGTGTWQDTDWLTFIKGRPAVDALHLGMWSLHLSGTGDIFGSGKRNEHHHLAGFQYRGFNAGTFINSHDNRTYSLGLSREVYTHKFTPDLRFDAGYRAGLIYGYEEHLPSIGGISAYVMPVFGFSWKNLGFDIGVIPVGVLTLNFRIDLDRKGL